MSEIKTLTFPGDAEPREIVDAKARERLNNAITQEILNDAVNTALAQAKEIGEFDGKDGKDGTNGKDGSNGKDGVSPVVSVSDITGGNRVTITDASGEKSFDVINGKDGQPGEDGQPGADGSDYVLTDTDKQEIAQQAAELVIVPTDEHINSLINTALGVIENGAY